MDALGNAHKLQRAFWHGFVEGFMDDPLRSRHSDLSPAFARRSAGTDEPVADHPAHGRPQLVALAFDADGHYTPTVIRHPVNDTPWGGAA